MYQPVEIVPNLSDMIETLELLGYVVTEEVLTGTETEYHNEVRQYEYEQFVVRKDGKCVYHGVNNEKGAQVQAVFMALAREAFTKFIVDAVKESKDEL